MMSRLIHPPQTADGETVNQWSYEDMARRERSMLGGVAAVLVGCVLGD